MFRIVRLVVLTVVIGKSLIFSNVLASDFNNPKFFEYSGGDFINRLSDLSFGWFKSLSTEESVAYHQSITHAIMYADNGQSVRWFRGNASGESTPIMTYPSGNGYCRRIYIRVIAHETEKRLKNTACYNKTNDRWMWVNE
jgi:hypothetical protein